MCVYVYVVQVVNWIHSGYKMRCDPPQLLIVLTISWKKHHKKKNSPQKKIKLLPTWLPWPLNWPMVSALKLQRHHTQPTWAAHGIFVFWVTFFPKRVTHLLRISMKHSECRIVKWLSSSLVSCLAKNTLGSFVRLAFFKKDWVDTNKDDSFRQLHGYSCHGLRNPHNQKPINLRVP